MLGFLDSIVLLLAFKGIRFPLSGAGEKPWLLCVYVCVPVHANIMSTEYSFNYQSEVIS